MSRNNESQRTPRRAADAAAAQHHQQHLQHLQAQLGAGSVTGGALPMSVDASTGGCWLRNRSLAPQKADSSFCPVHARIPYLSLLLLAASASGEAEDACAPRSMLCYAEGFVIPGPSLNEAMLPMGNTYPMAGQQAAAHRGSACQQHAPLAAQFQQQARYVVPPPAQQHPHSARLPASASLGMSARQQPAQQPAQQQAPSSARGIMQRMPHFFGGGWGRGGAGGGGEAAPASARAAPATSRQPTNPYLQARRSLFF